jgi:hypothetical protein
LYRYNEEDPAEYVFEKHSEFPRKGDGTPAFKTRGEVFPASLGYHWHGGAVQLKSVDP